jgi:hypothetical protein
MEMAEARASFRKQRKDRGERAKMGRAEGTDISRFLDRHSKNKKDNRKRNILKRERDRETKHDRRIGIDKGNIEMT